MNTTLTIQEKLKDLRVEQGLTLEQLADQTGLSKSALGKYAVSYTHLDVYKRQLVFLFQTVMLLAPCCDRQFSILKMRL